MRQIEDKKRKREIEVRCKKIALLVVGLCILFGGIAHFTNKNKEKKEVQTTNPSVKTVQEEPNTEETDYTEEQVKKFKKTKRGRKILAMEKKYPQIKKIIANQADYPVWLLEYLVGHEEAVNWVVDYPDYMKKSKKAINSKALKPINLHETVERADIPMLFQWDKTWGYASYGTGTIAVEGCGPTCLSMIAIGLKGDNTITPKKVANMSEKMEFYVDGQGTSWDLMTKGAKKLGLKSRQLNEWTAKAIEKELRKGNPMICSMGPGDFTDGGHFIVLADILDNGKIVVNDPNSLKNSQKLWDASVLLEQMKAMWTFER